MTKVYNRKTKQIIEVPQYSEGKLKFLYNNPFGRILLRFISGHTYSRINAWFNSRPASKRKIAPFVAEHRIKVDNIERYYSFADFFSRQEKRDFCETKTALISPADAKLLYYPIDKGQVIKIKNSSYTIEDLVGEPVSDFAGGSCLVFRLAMDDYHRYCFIDSGKTIKTKHIKGRLHTVSSISDHYRVFAQNDRIVNFLQTANFNAIVQIEIGALLAGRIRNRHKTHFEKGEEKGYFELGGSTIVLLLKKDIYLDDDIIKHSKLGIETKVAYGEKIGGK